MGLIQIYGGTVQGAQGDDMQATRTPANASVVGAIPNVGIPTTLVIMILLLVGLRVVYEIT